MLKVHIDKEIVVDAIVKIKSDPIASSKKFHDFLFKDSDLVIYGKLNQNDENVMYDSILTGRGDARNDKIDQELCRTARWVSHIRQA